ncbi:MAG: hypothetical protein AB7E21_18265 [Pseudodonghicola sp.]|uniref:hypothetical protein n=1 Tax=Pseudodonghicola sp. TaxID=1969463 RepID=UPI003A980E2A
MDTDLILVLGLVVVFFAIPALVSAFSDERRLRAPTVALLIGGGAMVYAYVAHPGGYTLEQLPDVFFGVIGRYFR